VHELAHRLRSHSERAREKKAQPGLWNVSADLEVNDAQWPALTPPQLFPPLLPLHYHLPEGKLVEFYYDELSRRPQSAGPTGKQPSSPDEGSGVHGHPRQWELSEGDTQAPAMTELEQEVMRRAVAEEVVRQKGQGTLPAGWVRWAEGVLTPQVDWREVLKRRIRGAIVTGTGQRMDYSFVRPHRRAAVYAPVLPPSLQGDFLPRVACVVDTSGSIGQRELAQALAEVRQVLESVRVPITVIPCDAVPYDPIQVFTQSQFLQLCHQLRGGGGTDMVVGIEAALRLRPAPDVVIVLTDGYTPFPWQRYRVPVIFGILDPGGTGQVPRPPMPPWRREDVIIIPVGS
jgi:predicted metal-dependent peptidase